MLRRRKLFKAIMPAFLWWVKARILFRVHLLSGPWGSHPPRAKIHSVYPLKIEKTGK